MSTPDLLQQTRQYYDGKLAEHGPTARGVDWNSQQSQEVRFRELVRLIEEDPDASVLDYGCGYGALRSYLRERGYRGPYIGFDISERMIETARANAGNDAALFVSERAALERGDYTLASGIFNVRQTTPDEEWRRYMIETIEDLAAVSIRGFAFNALTRYSDPDRRRPDLSVRVAAPRHAVVRIHLARPTATFRLRRCLAGPGHGDRRAGPHDMNDGPPRDLWHAW
jgi:SAM-dependent methyltransferase